MKKTLFLILIISTNLFAATEQERMDAFEKRIIQLEQKVTVIEQDKFHNKPYALLNRYARNFNPEKCDANIFDYVISKEEMREEEGQLVVQIVSELKTCERFSKKGYYVVYIEELRKAFVVEEKNILKI